MYVITVNNVSDLVYYKDVPHLKSDLDELSKYFDLPEEDVNHLSNIELNDICFKDYNKARLAYELISETLIYHSRLLDAWGYLYQYEYDTASDIVSSYIMPDSSLDYATIASLYRIEDSNNVELKDDIIDIEDISNRVNNIKENTSRVVVIQSNHNPSVYYVNFVDGIKIKDINKITINGKMSPYDEKVINGDNIVNNFQLLVDNADIRHIYADRMIEESTVITNSFLNHYDEIGLITFEKAANWREIDILKLQKYYPELYKNIKKELIDILI